MVAPRLRGRDGASNPRSRAPPSVAAVRIVSLLPSATEILFELGLGDDVVGVTFECNFPPAARTKRIVSTSALPEGLDAGRIDAVVKERMAAGEDLYRLDRGVFADLDPDLVVTQDLCAVCAVDVVDGRRRAGLPRLPGRGAHARSDDARRGARLDPRRRRRDRHRQRGRPSSSSVRGPVSTRRRALVAGGRRPATLVLEWTDPAFTAGHWVPDLVTAAGGECRARPAWANARRASSGRRSRRRAPRS